MKYLNFFSHFPLLLDHPIFSPFAGVLFPPWNINLQDKTKTPKNVLQTRISSTRFTIMETNHDSQITKIFMILKFVRKGSINFNTTTAFDYPSAPISSKSCARDKQQPPPRRRAPRPVLPWRRARHRKSASRKAQVVTLGARREGELRLHAERRGKQCDQPNCFHSLFPRRRLALPARQKENDYHLCTRVSATALLNGGVAACRTHPCPALAPDQ